MKKLKYTFVLFLFAIGFVFSCAPKEEQFAEGIKYLGGSDKKAEDQFKAIGLNPRDIAKEKLMKELSELKEGIEKKRAFVLVSLSNSRITKSLQRVHNLPSEYETDQAWKKSFEKGKAWCDYDLLFKDKIVSYEIEPLQASEYNSFDGKSSKRMSYRVYLRKEGQTGKLTLENSHVLVFEGYHLRNDVWVGFSIDTFVNHCPILSPEEEQDLKDFETNHPNGIE
ncbi:hypothetical protein FH589_05185 [Leptospira interrogans]|uniref:laminin-binding protein Lsa27 n=1 Tax=Leptospira TaxID=171 RepID=UPI0002B8C472|nr:MULTISPECIES: hypothetical protein [Leptospira]EMF71192.1 putative lipoprotein [Leptospira interrogans serovar Canicola str. LT1962]EMM91359.1 putative lipoprotein [Leptospira interrogans serovar Djasiman str. LT1649]MCL8311954.1 hypothetical protein [Leptospira interrogans]ULG81943.1 hypothetical protein FH595_08270 [Leptospira interrogans]ULG92388.1 hypothetical protein FH584_00060 [Leptospira interrogans]